MYSVKWLDGRVVEFRDLQNRRFVSSNLTLASDMELLAQVVERQIVALKVVGANPTQLPTGESNLQGVGMDC